MALSRQELFTHPDSKSNLRVPATYLGHSTPDHPMDCTLDSPLSWPGHCQCRHACRCLSYRWH
ncbi:hypothetical protein I79_020383 [Cricetulus griseus]|uniref:Uncharacterized protein n=1 Tax=Cricetulus griseus TaxID=10029 RepID=G3I9X2_CRIGR|nr:hypothetical protein I79_020383 [Cricetulus griseus]